MAFIKIPVELLNTVCQVAATAPVPYSQTQAMWKQLEQLRPEPALGPSQDESDDEQITPADI